MKSLESGRIERHSYVLFFFLKLADALVISGSLLLLVLLYPPTSWNSEFSVLAALAVIAFYLFSGLGGIYKPRQEMSFQGRFLPLVVVWAGVVLSILMVGYALKYSSDFSRAVTLVWFVCVPFLLYLSRVVFSRLVARFHFLSRDRRKVAIVGSDRMSMEVSKKIRNSPWLGMNFIGHFEEPNPNGESELDGPVLGGIAELKQSVLDGKIDQVYIILKLNGCSREWIPELIDYLSDTTVSIYLVPELYTAAYSHGHWSNLAGIPVVSIFDSPFLGVDQWLKRVQDVVLSSLILLLVSIPMLLIAMGIKLDSPGPVIFRQRRFGVDGREIEVWKFRSMTVQEDSDKVIQATRNDWRVTRIGAFLRRTSLDELPQFINVLQGTMSIVGPRPHAVAHNEQYRALIKGYMLRHAVKPGITGWAQINGWRGETDTVDKMEKRIEHDLWYIRHWSFWLDVKIILLTIFKGFSGKQAY
jgi:putative colanic acid biosynthesis UDP-glucose lipid carrier transferase